MAKVGYYKKCVFPSFVERKRQASFPVTDTEFQYETFYGHSQVLKRGCTLDNDKSQH